jgi:hypothetical protein
MDRTDRGRVLAALREVYDGRWDREVGTDGGQTLTFRGKCGLIAGCTTAIDKAHGVMSEMGPRSLFVRLPPADLGKIAGSALGHMGREPEMRRELKDATAGLLTHLPGQPHEVDAGVRAALIALASLVSQGRSPVHRDHQGEIDLVLDAEAPTRIIKQLGQLWCACGVLGLDRAGSWEVVARAGLDSIPKLRGAVIRYLAGRAEPASTTTVAIGVQVRVPLSGGRLQSRRSRTWGFKSLSDCSDWPMAASSAPDLRKRTATRPRGSVGRAEPNAACWCPTRRGWGWLPGQTAVQPPSMTRDLAGHVAGGGGGQEERVVDLFQRREGAGEQRVLVDGPGHDDPTSTPVPGSHLRQLHA